MASKPGSAGAGFVSIDVDASGVLSAFGRAEQLIERYIKDAARVTAHRIEAEAKRRVARHTGETASHIVAEESYDKKGWIVWVQPDVRIAQHTSRRTGRSHTQRVTYNAVGGWLEHGTQHMTARPFLFVSARLEHEAHRRRVAAAIQDALDEAGLGT